MGQEQRKEEWYQRKRSYVFNQIALEVKSGNWGSMYRKHYGSLSFEDVRTLYELWGPERKPRFHYEYLKPILGMVSRRGDIIVELGSAGGTLATKAMLDIPVSYWFGYDMLVQPAIRNGAFHPIRLKNWFHATPLPAKPDIFISTHTLEHMSEEQAIASLDHVAKAGCRAVVLEVPYTDRGKWGKSAHISNFTRSLPGTVLSLYGFTCFCYRQIKEGHITTWLGGWRKDDGK